MPSDAERLDASTSAAFRRAGLPLFSEDFSAAEDVFNRAAPLLGLIFLGEMLGAVNLDWPWWQNLLALRGWARDTARRRSGCSTGAKGSALLGDPPAARQAPSWPASSCIPALLPLIFNGQVTSAVVTLAANLLCSG